MTQNTIEMPRLFCEACEAGEVKIFGTPPFAIHYCPHYQAAFIGTMAHGSVPRWRAEFPVGEGEVIAKANHLRSMAEEAKALYAPGDGNAH